MRNNNYDELIHPFKTVITAIGAGLQKGIEFSVVSGIGARATEEIGKYYNTNEKHQRCLQHQLISNKINEVCTEEYRVRLHEDQITKIKCFSRYCK